MTPKSNPSESKQSVASKSVTPWSDRQIKKYGLERVARNKVEYALGKYIGQPVNKSVDMFMEIVHAYAEQELKSLPTLGRGTFHPKASFGFVYATGIDTMTLVAHISALHDKIEMDWLRSRSEVSDANPQITERLEDN